MPKDLKNLFLKEAEHDIYIIGTQECMRPIAKNFFKASKDKWIANVEKTLGNDYFLVNSRTLMGTNLLVFARKTIHPLITNVKGNHLSTGILSALGNKGAVAVSLDIGGRTIKIVNCHLSAGTK